MNDPELLTELAEFGQVLSTPVNGVRPLLVGGHAVSLWALTYEDRLGAKLAPFFPLLSKDLDVFGDSDVLDAIQKTFGGSKRLSGARSPVIGQVILEINGQSRKIEILRDVRGVTAKELHENSITLDFEGFTVRVLPPVVMFRAKVANVATIDQADRNDVKHVKIMVLVVHEYLTDLLDGINSEQVEARFVVGALEAVREILLSREADKCSRLTAIDLSAVWPRELLRSSDNERIRKFVEFRLPA